MQQFNLTELDMVEFRVLSKNANNQRKTVSYHLDGLAFEFHIPKRHVSRLRETQKRTKALELLSMEGSKHRVKVLNPILA